MTDISCGICIMNMSFPATLLSLDHRHRTPSNSNQSSLIAYSGSVSLDIFTARNVVLLSSAQGRVGHVNDVPAIRTREECRSFTRGNTGRVQFAVLSGALAVGLHLIDFHRKLFTALMILLLFTCSVFIHLCFLSFSFFMLSSFLSAVVCFSFFSIISCFFLSSFLWSEIRRKRWNVAPCGLVAYRRFRWVNYLLHQADDGQFLQNYTAPHFRIHFHAPRLENLKS